MSKPYYRELPDELLEKTRVFNCIQSPVQYYQNKVYQGVGLPGPVVLIRLKTLYLIVFRISPVESLMLSLNSLTGIIQSLLCKKSLGKRKLLYLKHNCDGVVSYLLSLLIQIHRISRTSNHKSIKTLNSCYL